MPVPPVSSAMSVMISSCAARVSCGVMPWVGGLSLTASASPSYAASWVATRAASPLSVSASTIAASTESAR